MSTKKDTDATAIPSGWGFTSKIAKEPAQSNSGQLYDFDAGRLAEVANDPWFRHFAEVTFSEQIELFEESGDAIHLWRAWRVARVAGDMPVPMLTRLIPHLDLLAKVATGASAKRAGQRERRDNMVRIFNTLMDPQTFPNLPPLHNGRREAVLKMIAKTHKTTPGAVEQVIIKSQASSASV